MAAIVEKLANEYKMLQESSPCFEYQTSGNIKGQSICCKSNKQDIYEGRLID